MLKLLLQLEWIQFKRSPIRSKLALQRGLVIFFKILILIYALGFGFGLNTILLVAFKNIEPTTSFFRVLPYYFFFEFSIRYFLDEIPKVDIDKYLHLPIPKKTLVNFLFSKYFFSYTNLLSPFLLLPFIIIHCSKVFGDFSSIIIALNLFLLSWLIHWLTLFIKTLDNSYIYVIGFFLLTSTLGGVEYFNTDSINNWIGLYLKSVLMAAPTILILSAIFYFTYISISRRYLGFLNADTSGNTFYNLGENSLQFLSKYGLAGHIADIEWKLILRHKKSRKKLLLSFLGLLYGLSFYMRYDGNIEKLDGLDLLFPSIFTTGIFIMNYGQFFLSWNTSHFDFYLNQPSGLSSLVKGKMLVFLFSSLIMVTLTLPYIYFGEVFFASSIAAGLFNAGINMHFITLLSVGNPLPMDINNNKMMNTEGIGCAQYIMGLPFFLVPIIIFTILKYFIGVWGALIGLGSIGVIGLALFPITTKLSIDRAIKNKYTIGENFRTY